MKIKKLFLMTAAVFSAGTIFAAENTVKLPAPQREGGMPLMQALNERSTKRVYLKTELTNQQISNLLWSANGVNRDNGKRTAPSAVNRREIELYLLDSKAVFKYDAEKNTLKKIQDGDFRKWAGQFDAPVYVALVGDLKKAVNADYARIDAGYVSQNIYLYCTSAGLGTCAIGSFSRIAGSGKGKMLADALKLNKKQMVILTHSVGTVK